LKQNRRRSVLEYGTELEEVFVKAARKSGDGGVHLSDLPSLLEQFEARHNATLFSDEERETIKGYCIAAGDITVPPLELVPLIGMMSGGKKGFQTPGR
jgi:hypothetical protein